MTAADLSTTTPPLTRTAMIDFFTRAQRPGAGLLGTEFEACTLANTAKGLTTVDYTHHIQPLLARMVAEFGWKPAADRGIDGEIVALDRNGAAITLEPGGQVELSGAPQPDAHASYEELTRHQHELDVLGRELGLTFLGTGFHPFATRQEINWMPKGRYAVMREYLPTHGALAHDMMLRTCTVQVNLDYPSERACGERFILALRLSSLLTALFANSPYREGQTTGYMSWRSRVWQEVDPVRCGLPAFAFTGDFSFERYVDWALSVPMFFVKRGGIYNPYHRPFAEFLRDGMRDAKGQHHHATAADWQLHLSTLFPEVRLKPFLEIRGADAGSHSYLTALPALCKGIFYDENALGEAQELVAGLTHEQANTRWEEARRYGLNSPTIAKLAARLVEIASHALDRAGLVNANGDKESIYLEPLRAAGSNTQAVRLLTALGSAPGADPAGRKKLTHGSYYAGTPV